MSVYTYLEVSTAHVTEREMRILTAAARLWDLEAEAITSRWPRRALARLRSRVDRRAEWGVPIAVDYRYGVWLTVPGDDDPDAAVRLSHLPNVAAVLTYARELKVPLVRLDSDGDPDPALALFEW